MCMLAHRTTDCCMRSIRVFIFGGNMLQPMPIDRLYGGTSPTSSSYIVARMSINGKYCIVREALCGLISWTYNLDLLGFRWHFSCARRRNKSTGRRISPQPDAEGRLSLVLPYARRDGGIGMRARWRLGRMRESWDDVSKISKRAAALRPFSRAVGCGRPGDGRSTACSPGY